MHIPFVNLMVSLVSGESASKFNLKCNVLSHIHFPSNPTDPMFFAGRSADIFYNNQKIGAFGMLHPDVLDRFDIPNPITVMEFNIEPFL